MKAKPDYDALLNDVVAESAAGNASSLDDCLAAVRRQRRVRRHTRWACLVIAPLLLAGAIIERRLHTVDSSTVAHTLATAPEVIPGTRIEIINDQELLRMFPDRPVAIIGNGANQRFLFLDGSAN